LFADGCDKTAMLMIILFMVKVLHDDNDLMMIETKIMIVVMAMVKILIMMVMLAMMMMYCFIGFIVFLI
jgi:hypothetical protein